MKAVVARRARIARVRRIQHIEASGVMTAAEGRVTALESSASRLGELRVTLTPEIGASNGAALAHRGELAQRLEAARDGLTDAIVGARASAAEAAAKRLEARIRQESADRLGQRAVVALADHAERRLQAMGRRRTIRPYGDV